MTDSDLYELYLRALSSYQVERTEESERTVIETYSAFAASFDPISAFENTEALRRGLAAERARRAA